MSYVNFWKLPAAQYNPSTHGKGIFQCSDTGDTYIFGVLNTSLSTDNEDITSQENDLGVSVLKLADRSYSSADFSGKGYKILRKNIADGKNVLTQEMINETNTIYEIRYDFDLNRKTINIPEGCTLKFEGGSFSNGTIEYNHTTIENSIPKISIRCNCKGIIKFKDAINIYDCGAKGDGVSDDIQAFNVAIKSFQYYGHGILILGEDVFCISSLIKAEKIPTLKIIGNGASIKNITTSSSLIDKYSFNLNSVLEAGSGFFPTNDEGCLIEAAKAGDSYIVLKDDSYVSKIIIGKNYRITSDCIQKGGFPYNHYNFEIITPVSIDRNIVNLKNKLKYNYHETTLDSLYDDLSWTPSARLWTGNDIAFCSDNFYIENVKFLGDNNQLGGIGIQNCRNITVKNCYIQANLSFGEADNIEIINCYITGMLEPDKHINTLTIKNCNINNYGEGTGIKYLNLINNNINSLIRVYGFNINIKGNTILGREIISQGDSNAIVVSNSTYPIDSVIIENNLLINRYKDKTDVLVPAILLDNGVQITSGTINDNSLIIPKTANNFESISCHAIIGMTAYFNNTYYEVINVDYSADNLIFYFDKKIDNSLEISNTNIFCLGIFKYLYIKNNYYDGWYPINTINIVCKNKVIEDFINDNVMKFTYRTGRRADSFNAPSISLGDKILERFVYIVKSPTKINCTFRTNIVNIDLSTKGFGYVEYNDYLLTGDSTKENFDLNNIKIFYPRLSDINTIDDFNGEVEIYFYLGYKKGKRIYGQTSERPTDIRIGTMYTDTTLNKPIWWNGSEWIDSEGNDVDLTPITSGIFVNKPTGVDVGYAYFCTDKQTTEGTTNGIIIYHKGGGVWVDALGRVVE